MNDYCQKAFQRDAVSRKILDRARSETGVDTDQEFEFIILRDSHSRSKDEQDVLLKQSGFTRTGGAILIAAAAIFRVQQGFPKNSKDIGTDLDDGDLFQGKTLRTDLGLLVTSDNGLLALNPLDSYRAQNVFCAGTK